MECELVNIRASQKELNCTTPLNTALNYKIVHLN